VQYYDSSIRLRGVGVGELDNATGLSLEEGCNDCKHMHVRRSFSCR